MTDKTFRFVTTNKAGKALQADCVTAGSMAQALQKVAAAVSDDALSITVMDTSGFPKEGDHGD